MNDLIDLNKEDRLKKFTKHVNMSKKWGEYVEKEIEQILKENNLTSRFLTKREKRFKSFESKIITKGYKKYLDCTDYYGIRIIFLLDEEVCQTADIIQHYHLWIASFDKDYHVDEIKNPQTFDYQSMHFTLKPILKKTIEELGITEDTVCEVQIRTLLQHAYGELTHDLVYKNPSAFELPQVIRKVSMTSAIIEATRHVFSEIGISIKEYLKQTEDNIEWFLEYLNSNKIKYNLNENLNIEIYKNYFLLISDFDNLKTKSEKKEFIMDIKRVVESEDAFLEQPSIVIVVYLIKYNQKKIIPKWKHDYKYIEEISRIIGVSIN